MRKLDDAENPLLPMVFFFCGLLNVVLRVQEGTAFLLEAWVPISKLMRGGTFPSDALGYRVVFIRFTLNP